MKNLNYLLTLASQAILLLLLLTACSKDDEGPDNPWGLPNATQEGKNTFGCLINGEPWMPEIEPGVLDATLRELDAYYNESGDINHIFLYTAKSVSADDSVRNILSLDASFVQREGFLTSTENNLEMDVVLGGLQYGSSRWYYLDTTRHYEIEVTFLDTINNICAGRFEFYAARINGIEDTVRIEDGRFDLKYSTW